MPTLLGPTPPTASPSPGQIGQGTPIVPAGPVNPGLAPSQPLRQNVLRRWPRSLLIAAALVPICLILAALVFISFRVWHSTPLNKFIGHTGTVTSLAVSADGKYVVSGSDDKTIRRWYIGDLPASTVGR